MKAGCARGSDLCRMQASLAQLAPSAAPTLRNRSSARSRCICHSSERKVCIIGAGAAGCAAAWSLSRHPDRYQVEVWEAGPRVGGHASTLTLPDGTVMNDCVLGGTYSGFNNTLALLQQMGWKPHHDDWPTVFAHNQQVRTVAQPPAGQPQHVIGAGASQAAAAAVGGAAATAAPTTAAATAAAAAAAGGGGRGGSGPTALASSTAATAAAAAAAEPSSEALAALQAAAWGTTMPDSPLYAKHARDIHVFVSALRGLWDTKQVTLLLVTPLRLLCRLLLCSNAFWEEMVAPLGVVFFGTGNRMADCPVIILAGAFFDVDKGPVSFESDSKTLIKQGPGLPFFQYPRMDCLYHTIAAVAAATGNVTFKTSHGAAAVHGSTAKHPHSTPGRQHAGSTDSSSSSSNSGASQVLVVDAQGGQHWFDDVIMAVHSKAALQLLQSPSRLQQLALGSVEYYTQSTIMHTDEDYIRRKHPLVLQYNQPAWHVQQLTECTFELVYQFKVQLLQQRSQHDADISNSTAAAAVQAAEQHSCISAASAAAGYAVGSTTATMSSRSKGQGTGIAEAPFACTVLPERIWQVALPGPSALSEINPSKVLSVKTYEHPAHTVAHFLRILAFMSRVQGQGHVWFAGGWTFVDAHEFAIISGLAAAERLGAGYPFADNKAAADIYRAYMAAVHGKKQ